MEHSYTKDFYLGKIEDEGSIVLDMSLIVGIGGESIILKTNQNIEDDELPPGTELAVKASPCKIDVEGNIGFIDTRLTKQKEKLPELIPTSFKHKNIVRYWRNLLQKFETNLYHLSGMFKKVL